MTKIHMVVSAEQRHPPGLGVLYLTELWERFSFYGLKALLVLYLNAGVLEGERFQEVHGCWIVTLMFGSANAGPSAVQGLSSRINQLYSGAAYLTPLAGGLVADRILGTRPTMIIGGLAMAAGHGCMAYEPTFLVGLLLLVLGNGGFKPTISAMLSRLYEPPGPSNLRERGFAIFYTGINIGALLAPLVCGALQQKIGYDAGFGAAGIGMLVGLGCFFAGAHHLPRDGGVLQSRGTQGSDSPTEGPQACSSWEPLLPPATQACSSWEPLLPTPKGINLKHSQACSSWEPLLPTSKGSKESAGGLATRSGKVQRDGMAALLAICVSIIPFWVSFEQWSNVVPLYARDLTERTVLRHELPAAWLQSLSPLFCIALMPLVTGLWAVQSRRGSEPQPCLKLAIGCLLQGCAWLVMAVGSVGVSERAKATLALPVVATLLLTLGQVYVGPVGLSLISRCCPAQFKSTGIGSWFLAGGLGGLIAGPVGALYSTWSRPRFFALLSAVCVADAAFLASVGPRLHRVAAATLEDGEVKRKRDDDRRGLVEEALGGGAPGSEPRP